MKESNKTIAITLRFWTNGLPKKVGDKNGMNIAWSSGMAILEGNKERGIKAMAVPFNSLEDSKKAIQKLLSKSAIVLAEDICRTLREGKIKN